MKTFRENKNSLSRLSAYLGYFSAFRFSISRAAGIRLKAIPRKRMLDAIALFLTFSKNASLKLRIPHVSTFMPLRLIPDYTLRNVYSFIITTTTLDNKELEIKKAVSLLE